MPHLDKYMPYFEYFNISNARATVFFKLDQYGQIELKNVESNSSFFKVYNVLSFAEFMVKMNEQKQIVSAKSIDRTQDLAMNLSFPIDFKISEEIVEEKSRVIAILHDHELKYELRLSPSREIKIYEVNGERSIYLGKYNTLEEIVNTLPYKNLVPISSEWTDLGNYSDETGEYSVKVKNIFNRESFSNQFVVYKLKGKKYKVLAKFSSLKTFIESDYFSLIERV